MKVLVTGGSGFIGSHLIERLIRQGHKVTCLAKEKMNLGTSQNAQLSVLICDLNETSCMQEVLEQTDIVYHLAGLTRARNAREYYAGNAKMTGRMIELCKQYGTQIKRFVHISSLAAAGPALNGAPVTESDPCHPVSHYGKSKFQAEQAILSTDCPFPVTIIRPSAVYGPRDRDLYKYYQLIINRLHPIIGFKKKKLNLIHVDDLVRGICAAGESDKTANEIIHLGSARAYTNEEIGDAIASAVDRKPLRIHLPHSLVYVVGAAAELFGKLTGQQVFFNLQKVNEAVQESWDCSIKKAELLLGFHPLISLNDGIASTYDWYVRHNWLKANGRFKKSQEEVRNADYSYQ